MTSSRWASGLAALPLLVAVGCGAAPAPQGGATTAAPPTLPTGDHPARVEVPRIPAYVSVARAQRILARAGLVGVEPDVDWPHYFVGTRPRAGTPLPWGSEVRLLIGDG